MVTDPNYIHVMVKTRAEEVGVRCGNNELHDYCVLFRPCVDIKCRPYAYCRRRQNMPSTLKQIVAENSTDLEIKN